MPFADYRVYSSRLIRPDAGSEGVKLKVVEQFTVRDPRQRNQDFTFTLRNSPNGKRTVKVVDVKDLSTSTTGDSLQVERLIKFREKTLEQQFMESISTFWNARDPVIHRKTHTRKIYATDGNGNKNTDVWIKVRRTDQIHFVDPNDRSNQTIFYFRWPDLEDAEWDYTDVPTPIEDWSFNDSGINPPWRLDPFQDIIDCSFSSLCMMVLYDYNKVAAIPMSVLDATGATGATGGATGGWTATYQKTLEHSNWEKNPIATSNFFNSWFSSSQYRFDKDDPCVVMSPINIYGTDASGATAATGGTGTATNLVIKQSEWFHIYLTGKGEKLDTATKTNGAAIALPFNSPPIDSFEGISPLCPVINSSTDGKTIYTNRDVYTFDRQEESAPKKLTLKSTLEWNSGDITRYVAIQPGAIASDGTYYWPTVDLGLIMFQQWFGYPGSYAFSPPYGQGWEANYSLQYFSPPLAEDGHGTDPLNSRAMIGYFVSNGPDFGTATRELWRFGSNGAEGNPSITADTIITQKFTQVDGADKITGGLESASVNYLVNGMFERDVSWSTLGFNASFQDDYVGDQYAATRSVSQIVTFPPSLGDEKSKRYFVFEPYYSNFNGDGIPIDDRSLTISSPYGDIVHSGEWSGGYSQCFSGWLHISNGSHFIQGFATWKSLAEPSDYNTYYDDAPANLNATRCETKWHLYLDGHTDIKSKIEGAIGTTLNKVQAIFLDVPLSTTKRII